MVPAERRKEDLDRTVCAKALLVSRSVRRHAPTTLDLIISNMRGHQPDMLESTALLDDA